MKKETNNKNWKEEEKEKQATTETKAKKEEDNENNKYGNKIKNVEYIFAYTPINSSIQAIDRKQSYQKHLRDGIKGESKKKKN